MIWAHGYDGGSSSGNAFDIPNDKFVVTLGNWGGGGTPDQKVGTFIHEFGHALGQQHGGTDGTNYKPNYLSVMNYAFQTTGVTRTGTTAPYFGYSYFTLPSLNETKLDERLGLKSSAAQTFRTKWVCPSGSLKTSATRSDKDLDWNCKSGIQAQVSTDTNRDGSKSTLSSYNNWGHITYGGGDVGAGVSASTDRPSKLPRELTFEEHQRMR